jgi:hypothetical protein
MKARSFVFALALSVSGLGAGPASADGLTADQLSDAGFVCFPAGPSNWIHCMDLDKLVNGHRTVPVKAFSVDGSEYLGTEMLLHQDVYAGQPCPQDDLNLWEPLEGTPYLTCHHFLTGHH